MHRAVELTGKAQTIYQMGARRVYPIAAAQFYAFAKPEVRAILIDNHGGMAPEQAMTEMPHDVLVVVSFAPCAPVSIETARQAKARVAGGGDHRQPVLATGAGGRHMAGTGGGGLWHLPLARRDLCAGNDAGGGDGGGAGVSYCGMPHRPASLARTSAKHSSGTAAPA